MYEEFEDVVKELSVDDLMRLICIMQEEIERRIRITKEANDGTN
jgi:uncharacterized small protein (DUF1192 family)